MSCELRSEGGKLFAVLSFHREQLLYDIKNASYIEGSVMEPETPDHNRHMVQDVGEEGNVDRVTRILDLTVAESREMLYTFTRHSVHNLHLDDKFKEQKMYGIVLKVPTNFSQTTLNYLEKLIHEFLVCRAQTEWLRLTYPAKADLWKERSEEIVTRIRSCLNTHATKTRIRPHFLG